VTKPYIVAFGGTLRSNSSTAKALQVVLTAAEALGARTRLFDGPCLDIPIYVPDRAERTSEAQNLIHELRRADGIVVGSPGYHGGISGLVKNALDYTEDLRDDARPYFEGRAIGCIATGQGWQGANATLVALRGVVHALRGWPTPIGAAINSAQPVFESDGSCVSPELNSTLELMANQIVRFARWTRTDQVLETGGASSTAG
jgi:FMN reductase